jgi:hypothetical protein
VCGTLFIPAARALTSHSSLFPSVSLVCCIAHCIRLSILGWLVFLVPEPELEAPAIETNGSGTIGNTDAAVPDTNAAKGLTHELSADPIIDKSDEVVKEDQKNVSEGSSSPTSVFGRMLVNVFLVCILGTFLADSAPLSQIQTLLPNESLREPLQIVSYYRLLVVDNVVYPYLSALGLDQFVWNMFCIAPDMV